MNVIAFITFFSMFLGIFNLLCWEGRGARGHVQQYKHYFLISLLFHCASLFFFNVKILQNHFFFFFLTVQSSYCLQSTYGFTDNYYCITLILKKTFWSHKESVFLMGIMISSVSHWILMYHVYESWFGGEQILTQIAIIGCWGFECISNPQHAHLPTLSRPPGEGGLTVWTPNRSQGKQFLADDQKMLTFDRFSVKKTYQEHLRIGHKSYL